MHLRRHAGWTIAALVFAALVLPFLVYYTGLQVFGAYQGGGPVQFLGDFYADLGRLRPGAWLFFLTTCFCLSFSAFYEMIEWWVAIGTGDDAVAFLAPALDIISIFLPDIDLIIGCIGLIHFAVIQRDAQRPPHPFIHRVHLKGTVK